eukprot:m.319378 g.319378  ORF g.319378 m.319378 type:complete len:84 (-) comp20302_c0_seq3:388-639(-)
MSFHTVAVHGARFVGSAPAAVDTTAVCIGLKDIPQAIVACVELEASDVVDTWHLDAIAIEFMSANLLRHGSPGFCINNFQQNR